MARKGSDPRHRWRQRCRQRAYRELAIQYPDVFQVIFQLELDRDTYEGAK